MAIAGAYGKASADDVQRAIERFWDITLADIESGWMDVMVKRLFKELSRQLEAIEGVKYDKKTEQPPPPEREKNARVLAILEHTMERLARLEKQRLEMHEQKKTRSYDNTRAEVERRLNKRAAARKKKSVSR